MSLRVKLASATGAWRIDRALASMASAERIQLRLAREAHPGPANTSDPLVTVTIPTFNRATLLTERSLPSVLGQSYSNLEVVVVGDHCTDDTAARVTAIDDARLRFINLPEPSTYPPTGLNRWRVAGSVPLNRALFEARGEWIAYMDDDDEMLPSRIERSLEVAAETGSEFVCGQVAIEKSPGDWKTSPAGPWPTGRRPFRPVAVPHSAATYRSYLRFLLYDSQSYKIGLPTDRHWVYRLARAGVKATLAGEIWTRVPLRSESRRGPKSSS